MTATDTPLLTVTDGRQTVGFLLRRGRKGTEGFDANNKSLGLFKNEDEAARAVWRGAHGQASMGSPNV
jgi:hypothetical protein